MKYSAKPLTPASMSTALSLSKIVVPNGVSWKGKETFNNYRKSQAKKVEVKYSIQCSLIKFNDEDIWSPISLRMFTFGTKYLLKKKASWTSRKINFSNLWLLKQCSSSEFWLCFMFLLIYSPRVDLSINYWLLMYVLIYHLGRYLWNCGLVGRPLKHRRIVIDVRYPDYHRNCSTLLCRHYLAHQLQITSYIIN